MKLFPQKKEKKKKMKLYMIIGLNFSVYFPLK